MLSDQLGQRSSEGVHYKLKVRMVQILKKSRN